MLPIDQYYYPVMREDIEHILPKYGRLAAALRPLIETVIREAGIEYLSVTSRVKTIESCMDKIKRKGYQSPEDDIHDLAGARVIVYFNTQAMEAYDILRSAFNAIDDESGNSASKLGVDKIGYRSLHIIGTMGRARSKLPEYKNLSNLKFEIQIRTVLQHAWAELAHDRSYKLSQALPEGLDRKVHLYAGLLEIADVGFDEISREIDTYRTDISSISENALMNLNIDAISLEKYLDWIQEEKDFSLESSDQVSSVVDEVKKFGISKIGDLHALLTEEILKKFKEYDAYNTYIGAVRDILMISDISRYISRCWSKRCWESIEGAEYNFLCEKYGDERVDELFSEYGIDIMD